MERLHALFILAWALVRSLLLPFVGRRRGLADFRRSYAGDRLPPIAAEERRYLHQLSGCIACGLCDAGEGGRIARSNGTYAGVMDLMLASSRSMPDYDAAVRSFDAVGDDRLGELEARCPVRLPMRKVASFVRAKAAEVTAPRESGRALASGPKRIAPDDVAT